MKKETLKNHKAIIIGAVLLLLVCQVFAVNVKSTNGDTVFLRTNVISPDGNNKEIRTLLVSSDSDTMKTKKHKRITIKMNTNDDANNEEGIASSKPYLGIYPVTVSPKKSKELGYVYNYGILVTGVVTNSAADKQGLVKNDILMKFDNKELTDQDTFNEVLDGYKGGDKVNLVYFRDGKENQMEFTFGSKKEAISISSEDFDEEDFDIDFDNVGKSSKKGKSVGYGGGTWMPIFVDLNMDDVNSLITRPGIGFSSIKEDGILFNGGGGKIGIGKGLFIGGMGAGYSTTSKTNATVGTTNVIRRLSYSTGFGGVTLDKRFAITRNFIASFGMMIGGASQTIELSQTEGNFNWGTYDTQIQNSMSNYIKFEKSYILAQPKMELLYRLNSWLGIRAEGGYLKSYSYTNGWKCKLAGDTFEFVGSPDTNYDAYTISVGPWFGF